MSDDATIVYPSFGDPVLTVDRSSGPNCQHHFVVIRTRTHQVVCRVCKADVDPFEVLLTLSHDWDWATHWSKELDERSARVERLKAEESNIKARVRKVYRAAPEPKAALYFNELLPRLAAAETYEEFHEVRSWAMRFPWLDSKQEAVAKEAYHRAEERCRKNSRKSRRKRLSVVPKEGT